MQVLTTPPSSRAPARTRAPPMPRSAGAMRRLPRNGIKRRSQITRLARTEAKVARDAAFTAASQAADARKKAETAEAPTRAVSLWNKAETEQRDAASALEGRTFDKAQAKFAAAAKLYQDAEESARGDVLRVERQKARAAQADCAAAREEAERAQARDLAPTTFAIGQQKEDDAAAALDSDPVTAQKGFTEAGRQYKQAAKEGIAQRVTLLRTRVEQARARMTNARHEAERAGANQRARTLFDWGLRKERDAGVAFGENKYALAEQLFAGAQADYEITALEARRPEDGMTPAQLSAEQARRRAVAYREKAVKAGADRLVELAFGFAHTAEVGADKLMSLKSFERATTRYGEAGDGYLDVTSAPATA